jgi:glycosyltransferase involved in cell wall biosynthesis
LGPTHPVHVVLTVSVDWFFLSHRLPIARALRERGWRVTVATQETDGREAIEREGLELAALPLDRGSRDIRREVRVVSELVRLYRSIRPDIVHHVSPKAVLYGTAAARATGIPRVINAVSGLGYAFIERDDERPRDRLLRAAVRAAYQASFVGARTRVIFQNRDDAAVLGVRALGDEGRYRLIRGSGVDVDRFRPAPLPSGRPLVLLPARLLGDKGVREFVSAARMLRAEGSQARFVLAGRADPQNPAGITTAEVARWVASGDVEWIGHVEHHAMPELLRDATLVVLPSYREGMPLVLAEAASSERACIATDVPGCREVVTPGVTGWLVPPRSAAALAEAMRDALGDPLRLARYGAAGRRLVVDQLSLASVVRRTLGIYDELLAT